MQVLLLGMQILLSIARPDSPLAIWDVGHHRRIFAVRNQRGAWLLERDGALPTLFSVPARIICIACDLSDVRVEQM
jgi:hypothetical protein